MLVSFLHFEYRIKKSHSQGDKTTETEKGTKTPNDLVPKRSNQDILGGVNKLTACKVEIHTQASRTNGQFGW